jgi:hypothetical protein
MTCQGWHRREAGVEVQPIRNPALEESGQRHAPASLLLERPGTCCIGGRVDLENGLDGMENLVFSGIRCPDLPARRESLCCLC